MNKRVRRGTFAPVFDGSRFSAVFDDFECGCDVTVNAYEAEDASVPRAENGTASEETFRLSVSEKAGGYTAVITCRNDTALLRGLYELKRQLRSGVPNAGEKLYRPFFAVRGYIEGFYGKPWTHPQRLEMLRFMAENGVNTWYYAPKDDPYHRKLWREKYPETELSRLCELAGAAARYGIKLHYCIAPGLSMRYSSEKDRRDLWEKLRSVYDIGIRDFGLLLDDIPEELFYEEDRAAYGETVNAHIDLCRACYGQLKKLGENTHLTVCPLQYHGKGTEDFITRLGRALPEDVSLFFTGDDICSKELTCREAEIFERATGHKPLYWDNYPVNDAEMFKEMHLAPLIGREPDLYKYAEGIISNCMEYFECNKFPLYTAAEYLRDPGNYDPEQSFSDALRLLLPDDIREHFLFFADHLRTSCLHDENSRRMGECFGRVSVLAQTGREEEALRTAAAYTAAVRASADALKKQKAPLFEELGEWLSKYYLMADILDEAVRVLNGAGTEKLSEMMEEYNSRATVLTSFCFREFVESVIDTRY